MQENNNKNEDQSEAKSAESTPTTMSATGPATEPVPEPTPDEKKFYNEFLALNKNGLLVKKDTVTLRQFALNNGKELVAFTLNEAEDSFSVGLPGLITIENSLLKVKVASVVPMVRLYKSSIMFSSMPNPKYLLSYLINTKSLLKTIPGYFNTNRSSQVDILIFALQQSLKIDPNKPDVSIKSNASEPESQSTEKSFRVMEFNYDDEAGPKRKIKYKH